MQKGNLPGSTTRNTKGVKYIKSYVKKVNEKEYYIAEGAVVLQSIIAWPVPTKK